MGFWAVLVPAQLYATERTFSHETLELGVAGPVAGDHVLLVAEAEPRVLFGSAVTRSGAAAPGAAAVFAYTRRHFDAPQPAGGLALDGAATPLDEAAFHAHAAWLGPPADRRSWLVSLDLPIEAETPAEAVRQFWTFATELGPGQLPVFVAPVGDELAMRAYLLGDEANLDPEEDDGE
ncbi:MAG TPA: hypothetical protein VFM54_05320 [Micromonosporaceae bacterium]|nr:hypothetical protein [Micromonosporaceae bacterium]